MCELSRTIHPYVINTVHAPAFLVPCLFVVVIVVPLSFLLWPLRIHRSRCFLTHLFNTSLDFFNCFGRKRCLSVCPPCGSAHRYLCTCFKFWFTCVPRPMPPILAIPVVFQVPCCRPCYNASSVYFGSRSCDSLYSSRVGISHCRA